jgi:hypothetical protein
MPDKQSTLYGMGQYAQALIDKEKNLSIGGFCDGDLPLPSTRQSVIRSAPPR